MHDESDAQEVISYIKAEGQISLPYRVICASSALTKGAAKGLNDAQTLATGRTVPLPLEGLRHAPPHSPDPTHVRYRRNGLTALSGFLLYVDRYCQMGHPWHGQRGRVHEKRDKPSFGAGSNATRRMKIVA
jgi:hypothetical protein